MGSNLKRQMSIPYLSLQQPEAFILTLPTLEAALFESQDGRLEDALHARGHWAPLAAKTATLGRNGIFTPGRLAVDPT